MPQQPGDPETIAPGTRVEVFSRFDRSWARGFEIEAFEGTGYRLRRRSDGAVLPVLFAADDVRVERKRQGLWWA